jgi:predicted metal-binding membrane protein
MHGDSTMSMVWMRMPGQTWPAAAGSFIGMWVAMMVAMMLPSLVPMLWRYREAVRDSTASRLGWLTAVVSVGYFFVWTLVGVAIFPLGVAIEMAQLTRVAPIAVGAVVVLAGALQFTAWKERHLIFCRDTTGPGEAPASDAGAAWRHGLRLGLHCTYSCAGLTAMLLAAGVMDLRVMLVVAVAITVERFAPASARVVQAIGTIAVATGLSLIALAIVLG